MPSTKKSSKKPLKDHSSNKGKSKKIINVNTFSLDHLTETQFEEFCFDLLGELKFVNIKWRKGTGLSTSPSDRGRDIECHRQVEDVDGRKDVERWFVECKHSIKGVSPDKIQGALTWATAERPDKLLIIASNFLSNPTHDFLDAYEKNDKPHFKIKKWERTDLERLAAGNVGLLRKYKISGELPFISIMHPAHLLYINGMRFNTLDFFFKVLDKLESKKRDRIFDWAYHLIIRPRYQKPVTGKEKYSDLRVDELSYEAFKQKCLKLVSKVEEFFLVSSIVNLTLQAIFGMGNTTSLSEKLNDFKSQLQMLETMRRTHRGESNELKGTLNFIIDKLKESEPDFQDERVIEFFDKTAKMLKEHIQEFPDRVKNNHEDYIYLCEHVIKELLVEDAVR